jgi:integrase
MAKLEKITNSCIKGLDLNERRVNDSEISGFHLRISPKGKITYYLFYRISGKQVNFKLGNYPDLSPTQARDLAKAKLGEVANGVDVQNVKKEAKRKTEKDKHSKLETFLDNQYLPWLETRNFKTAHRIIKTIKRGFPQLLEKQLGNINAWDLEKWRSEKKKQAKSPSTINGYINYLKGAMSRAVEWGVIESHDLSKIKSLKAENNIVRFLSPHEEKSLRATLRVRDLRIKNERDSGNLHRQNRGYPLLPELRDFNYCGYLEPFVILAINTGMRRGEIFGLEWQHVDLANGYLTIIASNSKSGQGRHIPLNNEAKAALNNWLADTDASGFVFKGSDNKPLTDIKRTWNTLLTEAKIDNFRFHDLRHHFASKLVMAGVDLNTVRELMGHSDLKMTLRYAHLAPEHKAAAVNLIG